MSIVSVWGHRKGLGIVMMAAQHCYISNTTE